MGKSAHFVGFLREKNKNLRKNRPISWDFRGKNFNFEGFLEKSADFAGNFGGKLCQETISKKQPISLDFFGQISLKWTQFSHRYDQRCLLVAVTKFQDKFGRLG